MFKLRTALPLIGAAALAASLIATPAQATGGSDSTATSHAAKCRELLKNGSFEKPKLAAGQTWALFDEEDVQAWRTDDPNGQIEVWNQGLGVVPKHGRQLLELNATGASNSIFQDISTKPNSKIYWSFYIRARDTSTGTDVEATQIHFGRTPAANTGGVNGVGSVFAYSNTASDVQWKKLWGWYQTGPDQHRTRVTITAVDSSSADPGFGNLVDAVSVTNKQC